MNLAQGYQRPRLGSATSAELLKESPPVAFDVAALILLGESQIQGVPAIGPRGPSQPGAESMNKPRDASEPLRTKDCCRGLAGTLAGHTPILTSETLCTAQTSSMYAAALRDLAYTVPLDPLF